MEKSTVNHRAYTSAEAAAPLLQHLGKILTMASVLRATHEHIAADKLQEAVHGIRTIAGLAMADVRALTALQPVEPAHTRALENVALLADILNRRPAMNAGLAEAYTRWTSEVYDLMGAMAAEPAIAAQADSQPVQRPYSIDADPQGIRSRVAEAITGALAFGSQGKNPPPSGHWLAPFWNAARADRSEAESALKDAALLDWQASARVEVSPEYEGPWHAAVFGEDEKPLFVASGNTPREALIAARKEGGA